MRQRTSTVRQSQSVSRPWVQLRSIWCLRACCELFLIFCWYNAVVLTVGILLFWSNSIQLDRYDVRTTSLVHLYISPRLKFHLRSFDPGSHFSTLSIVAVEWSFLYRGAFDV